MLNYLNLVNIYMPDGISLLSAEAILMVTILTFIPCFISIVTGFGGAIFSMPLLTLIIPVKIAAPISIIVSTISAFYGTWIHRRIIDWKSIIKLIISSFIGIPFGIYALASTPEHLLKKGLGIFLVIYSLLNLFTKKSLKFNSFPAKEWIIYPCGFFAGIFGAALTASGPPIVLYGVWRNLSPPVFRGTLCAFFSANNIGILVSMNANGILTGSSFKLVVLSIPFMTFGWLIGNKVHNWLTKSISEIKIRKFVFIILLALGIIMLY